MKIIISERQLRQIIESENKISDKKLRIYKDTIDEIGLELAGYALSKELWEFIEMGLVEHYNEYLGLDGTPIKSLGNLKSVGGYLYLRDTPISRTMSKYDIKKKIKVANIAMLAS
jgi:hypothetical protein